MALYKIESNILQHALSTDPLFVRLDRVEHKVDVPGRDPIITYTYVYTMNDGVEDIKENTMNDGVEDIKENTDKKPKKSKE